MLISREPEVEVILLVKFMLEAFGLRPSHPLCYAMLWNYYIFYVVVAFE